MNTLEFARSYPKEHELLVDFMKEVFFFLLGPEFRAWFHAKPNRKGMKRVFEECKKIVLSQFVVDKPTPEVLINFILEENADARAKSYKLVCRLARAVIRSGSGNVSNYYVP